MIWQLLEILQIIFLLVRQKQEILWKYLELTKDISNHASIYVSIADAYGASGNLIKACEFYSKSADLGNLEVYDSKTFKNCK